MPKSILVVDDEPVVVEISRRKLEEYGYEIVTAHDGTEAFDRLKAKKPDLIILDIQMPKMNGYTFVVEKSKMPEYADIPVIAVTSYAEMEPLLNRHGVKAYLLKPLKLQDLIDRIVQFIGRP